MNLTSNGRILISKDAETLKKNTIIDFRCGIYYKKNDENQIKFEDSSNYIIYNSKEEHIKHINLTLEELSKNNIHLNKHKCHFMSEQIDILGYILTQGKIKIQSQKITILKNWKKDNPNGANTFKKKGNLS